MNLPGFVQSDVAIGQRRLPGILAIPQRARGLVIFAHGSGSSRLSPRNAYAAAVLQKRGFATLLFDLLSAQESADRRNVFDIALLASRVEEAILWARAQSGISALPIGLFGASTGAGAALVAAAFAPDEVSAVVSRGGRPDLAGKALPIVMAPTLLIVGSNDPEVLALNREARREMTCKTELVVIAGAGHLFEEATTLDDALQAAGDWFTAHLQEAPNAHLVS